MSDLILCQNFRAPRGSKHPSITTSAHLVLVLQVAATSMHVFFFPSTTTSHSHNSGTRRGEEVQAPPVSPSPLQ